MLYFSLCVDDKNYPSDIGSLTLGYHAFLLIENKGEETVNLLKEKEGIFLISLKPNSACTLSMWNNNGEHGVLMNFEEFLCSKNQRYEYKQFVCLEKEFQDVADFDKKLNNFLQNCTYDWSPLKNSVYFALDGWNRITGEILQELKSPYYTPKSLSLLIYKKKNYAVKERLPYTSRQYNRIIYKDGKIAPEWTSVTQLNKNIKNITEQSFSGLSNKDAVKLNFVITHKNLFQKYVLFKGHGTDWSDYWDYLSNCCETEQYSIQRYKYSFPKTIEFTYGAYIDTIQVGYPQGKLSCHGTPANGNRTIQIKQNDYITRLTCTTTLFASKEFICYLEIWTKAGENIVWGMKEKKLREYSFIAPKGYAIVCLEGKIDQYYAQVSSFCVSGLCVYYGAMPLETEEE